MKLTEQIATNLYQVYFSGNWTASNFKDAIKDVSIEMAKKKVGDLNTILALSYHMHYYVNGTMTVLKGGELTIRDKYSFDHPNIQTKTEWDAFKENMWTEAEEFIMLIKQLDDSILNTTFVDEKYGSYYRNLTGIIEHTHYHLGQICMTKKLLKTEIK